MKIIKSLPLHLYNLNDLQLSFIDKFFIRTQSEGDTFNRRMFNEDFSRIFNNVSRHSENLFDIESNNDELARKLFENTKTRYGTRRIDEVLRSMVEEIAASLVFYGTAYYFLHDFEEGEGMRIVPFGAVGVSRFLNIHFQWVPKRSERHWDRDDEEFHRELRILNSSKLINFSLPCSISKMLHVQNRALAILDKHQHDGTNFFLKATHENPTPKNDFNFVIWKDVQERVLYRSTRETGWNGRNFVSSKRSDFFYCHRLIRFRRNQLILRDHILNQLGNEFTRVGREYDANFYVRVIPASVQLKLDELDDLKVRLSAEEVGITEVIDFCNERSKELT
ncbi:hypothetical protein BJ925_1582 [Rahnella aquatilis]|nr:hypothetical protein BJ925_1582 [Rahnella aquatilis]